MMRRSFKDAQLLGSALLFGLADDAQNFDLHLIHALERRDEVAVWDLYRSTKDQARLLDWIASWSSIRTSKRKHPRDPGRTAVWVQILFAIPFVKHDADVSQSTVLFARGH